MQIKEKLKEINVSSFLQDYLETCGIKKEEQEAFLNPTFEMLEPLDNYNLVTMQRATEVLEKHILTSKIGLCMHMDIDSLLSNLVMYQYLKDMNPNVEIEVFFPRVKAQGLNKVVFEEILNSDIDLLILTDCSSSDLDEMKMINRLNELGWKNLDVIICDHHLVSKGKKGVENYACLINNQIEPNVVNKQGSGTLVVWKFLQYLDYYCGTNDAIKYIDLVAMSLVADAMNTNTIENRTILDYGLNNVTNEFLLNLIKEFDKDAVDKLTQHSLGWKIDNKINGIIKSGETELIRDLFFAFIDPNVEAEWEQGTKRITKKKGILLDKMLYFLKNKGEQKRELVSNLVTEIEQEIDKTQKVLTVFSKGRIPFAYGGDISNKFSSLTGKPTLTFMEDENENLYSGSCRSPVPLKELIQNSKLFETIGGHSSAFGYKIKKENIPKLLKYISTLDLNQERVYEVASSLSYDSMPTRLWSVVEDYGYLWGKGIENPKFHIKPIDLNKCEIKWMGNGNTLGLTLPNYIKAVKFFCTDKDKTEFLKSGEIELIVELSINRWNGQEFLQFMIEDYEIKEKEKKQLTWEDIF